MTRNAEILTEMIKGTSVTTLGAELGSYAARMPIGPPRPRVGAEWALCFFANQVRVFLHQSDGKQLAKSRYVLEMILVGHVATQEQVIEMIDTVLDHELFQRVVRFVRVFEKMVDGGEERRFAPGVVC